MPPVLTSSPLRLRIWSQGGPDPQRQRWWGGARSDPTPGGAAASASTPVAVFERAIAAVRGGAAGAVPGLPVVYTIKVVDGEGVITGTPDRATLWAVQTPQGFDATVLRTAYASGLTATDDAALVEAIGHHVRAVEGDPLAFKITTPGDLARAELLVRALP